MRISLAAFVGPMEDSENLDDLQAIETEACRALNDVFDKDVLHGYGSDHGSYREGLLFWNFFKVHQVSPWRDPVLGESCFQS